ncbi:MAG: hypothetical protein ACOCWR_04535, partial [Oceanidesulfovibrio sp.]
MSLRCLCGAVFPCVYHPAKKAETSSGRPAPNKQDSDNADSAEQRVTTFVADPDGMVRITCPSCNAAKT